MGVIDILGKGVLDAYNAFTVMLPLWAQSFINLFLLVLLIVLYSIFIWKFYRFIATKNIIELNLKKYNHYEHPFLIKFFAGVLYLLEYIIILPFLIFAWFSVFTLFLIFLTENMNVSQILIVSVTIIGAIRMISYIPRYGENLAKDVAKLLPFTLLAVSVLNPSFFDIQRIIGNFSQLPGLFDKIIIYLAFIIMLEIILRFFDFIFLIFGLGEIEEVKEVKEKEE